MQDAEEPATRSAFIAHNLAVPGSVFKVLLGGPAEPRCCEANYARMTIAEYEEHHKEHRA